MASEARQVMDDPAGQLDAALGRLHSAISGAMVRGDHLFPDLALLGLARDVFEHGRAVRILWDSDVPRACYSPARSAFEACQEVLFLGTRKDDYDYWGARARARELLDWERGAELANATGVGEEVKQEPPDEQLAKDAAGWSRLCPGKGDLLFSTMNDTRSAKGPGRYHWTGMTRAALPEEFAEATGGDDASVAIHRSMYSLLSLHSHPSPRIEVRSLRFEDGGFSFNVDGDADELAGAAIAITYVAAESAAVVIEDMFAGSQE